MQPFLYNGLRSRTVSRCERRQARRSGEAETRRHFPAGGVRGVARPALCCPLSTQHLRASALQAQAGSPERRWGPETIVRGPPHQTRPTGGRGRGGDPGPRGRVSNAGQRPPLGVAGVGVGVGGRTAVQRPRGQGREGVVKRPGEGGSCCRDGRATSQLPGPGTPYFTRGGSQTEDTGGVPWPRAPARFVWDPAGRL